MNGEIFAPFIFFAFLCKHNADVSERSADRCRKLINLQTYFLIICLTKQKTFSTAPLM